MSPTAGSILACLRGARLPLEDEKRLQSEMERLLMAAGLPVAREMPVAGGIIDFAVPEPTPDSPRFIGIEVKIRGGKRDIFRQLCGYCEDERLTELIVATSLPLMLPEEINGKPVAIVDLGRGWL